MNISSRERFINKSKKIHGERYNYDKVEYLNAKKNVIINCSLHGDFYQTPNVHLSGSGCPICSNRKPKVTNDNFIKKASEKHPLLIFDNTVYNGSRNYTNVVCKKHGEFNIHAGRLLKGQGCPICLKEKRNKDNTFSNEHFLNLCKNVHENKYDYSKTLYVGSHNKIKIICPIHGEFEQEPTNHLQGQGCPKCAKQISKEEINIQKFIEDNNIKTISTYKLKSKKHIDIYLPDYNVGIEYNGLLWHGEEYRGKNYHLNKLNDADKENIRLIQIFEDEWVYKKEIVKSRLLNLIGKTPNKIYARKCEIREVSSTDKYNFLETNHIQGNVNSKIKLGLYHNDELVSLMTFGHLRVNMGGNNKKDHYELSRFCNKLNTTVIGGASKLLSYFEKTYKPKEIISYADRRWSEGNLYKQLNFKKEHISKPNYFYFKKQIRENRFKYRKSELQRKFNSDMLKTEKQIMKELGYKRIYDCGNIKFVKKYLYN